MTVAVLIVNWNGGALLECCLTALQQQRRQPDHVIVVDNASEDDSLHRASRQLRHVEIIRLASNVGFARATNIAAAAAHRFDALALLNPDTCADSGWLEALMAAADGEPAAAAFASQIRLMSPSSALDGAGDAYHVSGRAWRNGHGTPWAQWPAIPGEVFAACAAAALYRREAFEQAGGLDERFFCYFEDVDLGFRLRLLGHRCVYVPTAIVRHTSSAVAGYRSDFAVYHGERNAVWTFFKNMPSPLLWLYLPHHVAMNIASLAYYPCRGQGQIALRAKWDAFRGLTSVLRDRKLVQAKRCVDARTIRRVLRTGIVAPLLARATRSCRPEHAGASFESPPRSMTVPHPLLTGRRSELQQETGG